PVTAMGDRSLASYNSNGNSAVGGVVQVGAEQFTFANYPVAQNDLDLHLLRSWGGDITCLTASTMTSRRTRAVYLPWRNGRGCRMQIDAPNNYEFFLPAPLNGCSVIIGGTRAQPIVVHANYDSPLLQLPVVNANWTFAQHGAAMRTHQL